MPLPSCGVNALITLRSGAEVSLSWDAVGRPELMELLLGSGAPQSRSYTYDARGRLQSRTVNGHMTAYGYAEPGWLTEELSHDSAGLLTSQQVYGYDDAGNRTSHERLDGAGVLESSRFFTYGTGNRLLSVDGSALTWDDLGGVTEDAQGYRIDRFPDGGAAMVGTPADPSGLLDVLGEAVTLPGSSVALEVVRAADGLPARLYDGSPTPHTRVWGNAEGPWPLAGDSEGAHWMWVGVEGMMVSRLEGATAAVDAMTDPLSGSLVLLGEDLLDAPGAWGTDLAVAERQTNGSARAAPGPDPVHPGPSPGSGPGTRPLTSGDGDAI